MVERWNQTTHNPPSKFFYFIVAQLLLVLHLILTTMCDNNATMTLPDDAVRFHVELEFVQNLSNPKYLNYLAQNGFLQQDKFISYLKYLTYWKQPQFLSYILFPQCLRFLDALIDNPMFCRELSVPQFVEFVHAQQGAGWCQSWPTVVHLLLFLCLICINMPINYWIWNETNCIQIHSQKTPVVTCRQ